MHLAYVCEDAGIPLDGCKGSSIHARSMILAFARLDVEVTMVSPRIGKRDWAADLPLEFADLDSDRLAVRAAPTVRTECYEYIGQMLDVIHRRKPIDAVYERLSLWGCGASRWCRQRAVGHWLEVNAPLVREAATHRRLADGEQAAIIEDEILLNASLLLPVSPWLTDWLVMKNCHHDRVRLLPNGVDSSWLEHEAPTREMGNGERPINVGFVGSLRPWHDLDTLIEALDLLPEKFTLTVAGDGPERQRLLDRSESAVRDGRARWLGAVPPYRVPETIDAMDICVAPYRDGDEFYFCPIKIFEYGARRRPVLAADLPELRRQFPDDSLAFYRPGDARSLAAALRELSANENLRERRAATLHAFVRQHTWIEHARQLLRWASAVAHAPLHEATG